MNPNKINHTRLIPMSVCVGMWVCVSCLGVWVIMTHSWYAVSVKASLPSSYEYANFCVNILTECLLSSHTRTHWHTHVTHTHTHHVKQFIIYANFKWIRVCRTEFASGNCQQLTKQLITLTNCVTNLPTNWLTNFSLAACFAAISIPHFPVFASAVNYKFFQ